jgi:hypothetical protein
MKYKQKTNKKQANKQTNKTKKQPGFSNPPVYKEIVF